MRDFKKADDNKPRPDLLPPIAIEEVAKVLAFGATKYAPGNWRNVDDRQRYIAAALRHVFAYQAGHDLDDETRLPHLAHAACCLLFLIECDMLGLGADTRFRASRASFEASDLAAELFSLKRPHVSLEAALERERIGFLGVHRATVCYLPEEKAWCLSFEDEVDPEFGQPRRHLFPSLETMLDAYKFGVEARSKSAEGS